MAVGAAPEMTGGRFAPPAAAETVIANAGREVVIDPSLTEMMIPDVVPTSDAVGVPDSRPLDVEKVAHAGRPTIEKVSVLPSGSVAVG